MNKQYNDWAAVFQYAADRKPSDGDGYWLFAPMLNGEIELFQTSVLSLGNGLRNFRSTTVTTDEVLSDVLNPASGQRLVEGHEVTYRQDAFHVELADRLKITSDDPNGAYRIQTWDAQNDVRADLQVRPASKYYWPFKGNDYITAFDSRLEGTITIRGKSHPVSAICAFEHSSWEIPTDGRPPNAAMPPFWQYEFVQWQGDGQQFGTFLWHVLDKEGGKIEPASYIMAYPTGRVTEYDNYEIVYADVEDHDGVALPGGWTVTATKGEESFSYTATVRRRMNPKGNGFAEFLFDTVGVYRGPQGEIALRGRGRTEYITVSYNPAKA